MNEEGKTNDGLEVTEGDMASIDPNELARDAEELAEKLRKNAEAAEAANAKFIQSDEEAAAVQQERQEKKDANNV